MPEVRDITCRPGNDPGIIDQKIGGHYDWNRPPHK